MQGQVHPSPAASFESESSANLRSSARRGTAVLAQRLRCRSDSRRGANQQARRKSSAGSLSAWSVSSPEKAGGGSEQASAKDINGLDSRASAVIRRLC